jgi:thymidylate synthase
MNNIDKQYQALLQDILDNGVEKKDRTGTGTISVFGRQIRHKMSDGFPLLTTKKMYMKGVIAELIWFLRGDTNIKYLVNNDVHIWDGDAYKRYEKSVPKRLPLDVHVFPGVEGEPILTKEEFINKIKTDSEFAEKWGDLGPIYGAQWREWYTKILIKTTIKDPLTGSDTYVEGDKWIDQIADLINDLKTNPDSRRMMVNAWNVGEIEHMVLPPCHYGFQVYTRELKSEEWIELMVKKHGMILEGGDDTLPTRAISLMWNQRSVDTFLGLPFNIASYGLLLEIIAKEVNMVPDELIGNLGDTHLYSNHIEQAKEQIGRKYTYEERTQMLKEAMGENGYDAAIKDLAPFGGGMSEYYEIYKIPTHTRKPYDLPKLKILDAKVDDIAHYEIDDFVIEGYKSHPAIKAPLSN